MPDHENQDQFDAEDVHSIFQSPRPTHKNKPSRPMSDHQQKGEKPSRPMSDHQQKGEKPSKPFGLKETVVTVGVIAASHLAYDVYDREFRTPPPTLVQQYQNLVQTNQATWDALVKIKGMTPPAVKNAK